MDILSNLDLALGKRVRLYRLLCSHGLRNGTMNLLPIDHGLEHGPRDFFSNPGSLDPEYVINLAVSLGVSGIVMHIGLAEKYMKKYAGVIPLVLKLNGKTSIPDDEAPVSPLTASLEDAIRLGADAVGYTLYVGTPNQKEDIAQFRKVKREADRYGMPIIVWSYPRGKAIEEKGGKESLYAVDYAARVGCELGADIIKINFPVIDNSKRDLYPEPYNQLDLSPGEAIKKVVKSAGNTMVLVSGGSKLGDEDLLNKVKLSMEAGATGIIFGRNIWQRSREDSWKINEKIRDIMKEYPR